MVKIVRNTLTGEEYCAILEEIGWLCPNREQIVRALEQSVCNFKVMIEDRVIGMGRIIGDGCLSLLLKDIVIVTEYQRQGIGTKLVKEMLAYIQETTPLGWQVMVELMSALHKEQFYEQLGFIRRPTNVRGAGMSLIVKGMGDRQEID